MSKEHTEEIKKLNQLYSQKESQSLKTENALKTKIMKLDEKKKTRKIKGSLYEYALINEKIPKPKKPIDENIPIMFLRR